MIDGQAMPWLGIAVAGGAGLLIGLERERRKRQPGRVAFAGVRTFTLAALAGALAQALAQPWMVVAGAMLLERPPPMNPDSPKFLLALPPPMTP